MGIGDYDSIVPSKIFCSGTYTSPIYIPRRSRLDKVLYECQSQMYGSFGAMFTFTWSAQW